MISQKLLAFTLLGAGWVLWLLIGLSILSVAVMLERVLFFSRRRLSGQFLELIELCQSGQLAKAAAAAKGDSMEAEVVRRAASLHSHNTAAVKEAVASTIHRRRLDYERWLFILGTLGNNAPFIGLFGTVLGIIRAFADLSLANKAGAGAAPVMAGISEALVATAVGLFVAIPAVLAFNIFQRLVRNTVGRTESLGTAIASGLHLADGHPADGHPARAA